MFRRREDVIHLLETPAVRFRKSQTHQRNDRSRDDCVYDVGAIADLGEADWCDLRDDKVE